MNTKLLPILAAAVAVLAGCTDYSSDINVVNNRIDNLEDTKIKTISEQITQISSSITDLEAADRTLESYIQVLKNYSLELGDAISSTDTRLEYVRDSLSGKLKTVEDAVAELVKADGNLDKRIDGLKEYVDASLSSERKWVEGTFATLEQYDSTAAAIAELRTLIGETDTRMKLQKDTITAAYTEAIDRAVTASGKSIRNWVNGELDAYFTAAEVSSRLDSLKGELNSSINSQRDSLTARVNDLEGDLSAAREEIRGAYEAAIRTAIEENNGVLSDTLAANIRKVNGRIDDVMDEVSGLKKKVDELDGRLGAVEEALKNLMSIAYIPRYSDGVDSVEYSMEESTVLKDLTLRFDVYPESCAGAIVSAYGKDPSILSVRAVYTMTRATAGDFVNLRIKGVETDESNAGVLSVTVSPEGLGADYLFGEGEPDASVILRVATGYCCCQSGYVELLKPDEGHIAMYLAEKPKQLVGLLPESAGNVKLEWTSDNTDVATVDGNGTVTAISTGGAKITARVEGEEDDDSVIATFPVNVYRHVERVEIKGDTSFPNGGSTQLYAVIYPDDAYDKSVTWRIEEYDYTHAGGMSYTVDENGRVSGYEKGIELYGYYSTAGVTVTVTTNDGGHTASRHVAVHNPALN